MIEFTALGSLGIAAKFAKPTNRGGEIKFHSNVLRPNAITIGTIIKIVNNMMLGAINSDTQPM